MLQAAERVRPGRSRIKGLRALQLRMERDLKALRALDRRLLQSHQHAAKFAEFRTDMPSAQLAAAARIAERLAACLADAHAIDRIAACLDDLYALDLPADPRERGRVKKSASTAPSSSPPPLRPRGRSSTTLSTG